MTTISVKLQKGGRTIDLTTTDVYRVSKIKAPVTVFRNIMTGGKTEGELIDRVPGNRKFKFQLAINGASAGENASYAGQLEQFINSGDNVNAVYLMIRAHDDYDFEPLWGQQGAYLRYEIISGLLTPQGDLHVEEVGKGQVTEYQVDLFINPFALGLEQQLAQATGGIYEDTVGKPDGISRGLVVAPAVINEVGNPIFGNATWNQGWTDGAGLVDTENTDPQYILFGDRSAKLVSIAGSATYDTPVTAPNTNTHCISVYAKLPDGGTITDEIQMQYPALSDVTETYDYVGDGWYRVWATAAGVASSQTLRFAVKLGNTVYIDGVQFEEGSYPSPLAHGDQLGVAWTSDVHGSDSTRTAGRVRLPEAQALDIAAGTVRMVWLPDHDSTAQAADIYFWEANAAPDWLALWDQSTGRFQFSDGTNAANSAVSQTYSAYVPIVFHWTFGPDGVAQYIAGAAAGSDATYTPGALTDYVYIGSTETATNHCGGTILGFSTFARAMTAAEITADYTNVSKLLNNTDPGKTHRIDHIPWEWTKDGDSTTDGVNDADDDNFLIVNGIPGSYKAQTRIKGHLGTGNFGADSIGGCLISFLQTDKYIDPGDLYADNDGTAQASCSGGEYDGVATTGTTALQWGTASISMSDYIAKLLANKLVYILYSTEDEDVTASYTNLEIAMYLAWANDAVFSEYKSAHIHDGQFYQRISSGLVLPDFSAGLDSLPATTVGAGLYMRRTDASTDQVRADFAQLVTEPLMRIWSDSNAAEEGFLYDSAKRQIYNWDTADDKIESGAFYRTGNWPELKPDQWNAVIVGIGDPVADPIEPDQLHTMIFDSIKITPRYIIL